MNEDFEKLWQKVKTQRDELRVQSRLAQAELKDEWQELEKKWDSAEKNLKQVQEEAKETGDELVASAVPREGKTSLAISMARLLAMGGHRAIVVDCDLRRPSVHKEMKLAPGPGLSECLSQGLNLEELIQEDPLTTAHILQAGTPANSSPEQLSSHAMQMILRHLKRKYDAVILDTSPILAVSDTLFLTRLADKTVFLTRWARTKRAVARLALERVVEAKADIAGVALSIVDVKSHAQYSYGDSGAYHGALKKYYSS